MCDVDISDGAARYQVGQDSGLAASVLSATSLQGRLGVPELPLCCGSPAGLGVPPSHPVTDLLSPELFQQRAE